MKDRTKGRNIVSYSTTATIIHQFSVRAVILSGDRKGATSGRCREATQDAMNCDGQPPWHKPSRINRKSEEQ